ncbi:MAG: hypothetical protein DI547_03640 [Sphingobium sp.]|nr:MAG: hypothetical protein DI547_03640 [Sphingobium sp.]
MTAHLKLRLHISEPWDFPRATGLEEVTGWTTDYVHAEGDAPNEDWELMLDEGFDYHERRIGRLLVSPRYVGEHLSRVFDAVVGFPVRIAYRQDGGWQYAMTGMLAIRHDDDQDQQEKTD